MKEYTVEIGGLSHTVQLSDDDAKARGLTEPARPATVEKSAKPANKAAAPADK